MTDHPVPDHGAETEISRLYPVVDYAQPGAIPDSGKIKQATSVPCTPGLGDMVIFYPWCLFEALDGDPTQVATVEVFPHYTLAAPRRQDPTIIAVSGGVEYFPSNYWAPQDIRPVAHPTAAYARTTRMNTQWQSFQVQDLRTDPHPLDAGGGAPNPHIVLKPCFWDVAVGDILSIGLWFHSVGGDLVAPVLRDGEYFRLAVAFGGMARTY